MNKRKKKKNSETNQRLLFQKNRKVLLQNFIKLCSGKSKSNQNYFQTRRCWKDEIPEHLRLQMKAFIELAFSPGVNEFYMIDVAKELKKIEKLI
ncbi:unnamed protein product [Eruca vesicaria subsp. sativa]|uniref:Uncharacterized protein n=1 Tax=Eruca vesicaria subsp. sativa TaxID=29727 RepID=A0ABC8JU55_ERUVS|nr:unnamed protein product [Eruca vesicaria subsp. sativa]